jgi:hypothetical protein
VTFSGLVEKAKLQAEYHVFYSDKDFETLGSTAINRKFGDKYGTEFDVSVTYPLYDKLIGKLEYANFNESDVYGATLKGAARKGDKEIFWLTAMYTF